MKADRELLEDMLERNETQLKALRSYIAELKKRTEEHGTDRAHFEEDLLEAEHNISYYESEAARIRKEMGAAGGGGVGTPPAGGGKVSPPVKRGIAAALISSVSLAAGYVIGARRKPRDGGGGEGR